MSSDTSTKTPHLLLSVLLLLDLLSGSFSALLQSRASKTVAGFKFHGVLNGIVDEGESSGLSTSKLASESKGEHGVLVLEFVHLTRGRGENFKPWKKIERGVGGRTSLNFSWSSVLETLARPGWMTSITFADQQREKRERDRRKRKEIKEEREREKLRSEENVAKFSYKLASAQKSIAKKLSCSNLHG